MNAARHGQTNSRLLDAAKRVLAATDRPMTAKEIAEKIAIDQPPSVLRGKTPHKTVQARISVDILKREANSDFYRYSPATFGLRSKLDDPSYAPNYKITRPWVKRSKGLSNEYVAVLNRSDLNFFLRDGFYGHQSFPYDILRLLKIFYVPRKEAEASDLLVQLVSYGAIVSPSSILTYEKGRFTSDEGEFIGNLSIGFGGHCNNTDIDMFDDDPIGLFNNLRREIGEELFIIRKPIWDSIELIEFQGFLVDSTTQNGQKHLGLASRVCLRNEVKLSSGKLGIKNLQWMRPDSFSNCFHKLEIWSQYFLKALYSN